MEKLDYILLLIASVVVFVGVAFSRTAQVYPYCVMVFGFVAREMLRGDK